MPTWFYVSNPREVGSRNSPCSRRVHRAVCNVCDHGNPPIVSRLVENHLDTSLAWSKETGWGKIVNIGNWRGAFFLTVQKFTETLSILKRILAVDSEVTPYAAMASFFDSFRKRLLDKYGEDAVMIGCIGPLKLVVIQAP